MSTTTIETPEFPRLTRITNAIATHAHGLWALIVALAVGDAASTYAALSLAREISASNPQVGEVNPATKGYLEAVNIILETLGIHSQNLTLSSLFPRVIIVMAILYGSYRLLPRVLDRVGSIVGVEIPSTRLRVLALPVYVITLAFAVVNNTMLAVPMYQRLVWDSGFHIMLAAQAVVLLTILSIIAYTIWFVTRHK